MDTSRALPLWVVYDHPTDFPDLFVARMFLNDQPTERIIKADTLGKLRDSLPPGLVCLKRHETDDPKVVEVWL